MSQQKKKFFFVTFNPVVRYIGVTKQRNMNMKKKKFVLLAIMAMTVLMLPGCEEDEYVLNIENGKFVVLEEPYKHPYASDITIKAVIFVEGESLPHRDRLITPYCISGHIPSGYNAGDTVAVRAKIEEIYPKGPTFLVADNVFIYKLKDIERI